VECDPQYHHVTCQDKVQYSVVPSGNLKIQSAMVCGPQFHHGTCQDKLQYSVVPSGIL